MITQFVWMKGKKHNIILSLLLLFSFHFHDFPIYFFRKHYSFLLNAYKNEWNRKLCPKSEYAFVVVRPGHGHGNREKQRKIMNHHLAHTKNVNEKFPELNIASTSIDPSSSTTLWIETPSPPRNAPSLVIIIIILIIMNIIIFPSPPVYSHYYRKYRKWGEWRKI